MAAAALVALFGIELNTQTNPYRPIYNWGELPEGRTWGSTSAVYPSPDGNIWVAERCGANTCVGSDLDPVLPFDTDGNLLRSFVSLPKPFDFHEQRRDGPAVGAGR